MPEICNLPTESLRASNRHPSFYSQIAARAKRRCQTRGQQNSTECHTIRQNATRCNENSCPRARARGNELRSPSLGMDCAQVAADSWSRRPRTVIPIDRTKPPVPQARTAIM